MTKVSVIITSFNEGGEVQKTIDSVRKMTKDVEVILIDDGSDDGSCESAKGVDIAIRHVTRIGIAYSRDVGTRAATGEAFGFVDAHQRIDSKHALNKCAELAIERESIVVPCQRGLEDRGWTGHGAALHTQDQHKREGLFGAVWRNKRPRDTVSRCTTLIVPGYVIPRAVMDKIRWADGLVGWGASEPAITVKAFFAQVPILHLCGPIVRHGFRTQKKIPYSCKWRAVARNHALTARICFEDETWRKHWRPMFARWIKEEEGLAEFDSPSVVKQHKEFQAIKRRTDCEYWRGALLRDPPESVPDWWKRKGERLRR